MALAPAPRLFPYSSQFSPMIADIMSLPPTLASAIGRRSYGLPLFTANLTDPDIAAARDYMRARVGTAGLDALAVDETCQLFLFYAADFLARHAERLVWTPLLGSIGVREADCVRYPQLYDALERNLGRLGCRLQRSRGERRFLGTLLREGGLPALIGDLGTRVREKIDDLGWDAIADEPARDIVAQEIAQEAHGALRSVLDSEDGVAALAGFLGDAYEVRFALASHGVDPSTLKNTEEVRRELARLGIEPPSVRSEQLLADVLTAFLAPTKPSSIPRPHLRHVIRRDASCARVLVHLDLALLDACDELRDLAQVAVTAHPCDGSHRFVERDTSTQGFCDPRTKNRHIEWRRLPGVGPTVIDARALDAMGRARVVPLDSIEWPRDPCLWFDASGELLSEAREAIRAGEDFIVLAQGGATLEGEGEVSVIAFGTALRIPVFLIEARGRGAVIMRGEGEALERIPCEPNGLVVGVFPGHGLDGVLTARVQARLPSLVLPEGVEATLSVAGVHGEHLKLGRVRSRVRLGEDSRLRDRCGTIRVRLEADDGRAWSARWIVLPRSVTWHVEQGVLVFMHDPSLRVEALNADVLRDRGCTRVFAREGDDRLEMRIVLPNGEVVILPFEVPRRGVHLRLGDGTTVPLAAATITERAIFAGACLQLDAGSGARLQVRTHGAEVLLHAKQPTARPIYVGLDAVLDAQRQDRVFKLPLDALVEGDPDDELSFTIVIPRRCGPIDRIVDGDLVLDLEIDPEDLPADPAIAMFAVTAPFDDPALVGCAFEVDGHRAIAKISVDRLPTTRGWYIVGLVDRRPKGYRAMSGCGKVSVPLGLLEGAPMPSGLSLLETALWEGNLARIGEALGSIVDRPDLVAWIDRFAHGARERRGFGLWLFLFYQAVMGEAPWLIFAAATRMPRIDWVEWFGAWSSEPGFTWLRLRRRDAECLARALPAQMSAEEKMALLAAAERVRPMPATVRHLMEQALFRGQSSAPVASLRAVELAAPSSTRLPRDWVCFGLPSQARIAAWRWIRGLEIGPDQERLVIDFLDAQLLRGQRLRALQSALQFRMRWRGKDNPFSLHVPTFNAPVWAAALVPRQRAEWETARGPAGLGNPPSNDVRQLDHDTLHMAILLTAWRDGGSLAPPRLVFDNVLRLEQLAPDLLGAWLAALQFVPRT